MASTFIFTIIVIIHIQVMYISGTYGYNCSSNCMPPSSPPSNSSDVCDEMTGHCLFGCKQGFIGEQCTIPCCHGCKQCHLFDKSSTEVVCDGCSEGYFMRHGKCSECNENCLGGCNHDTGRCNHGCKPGFYGSTCSQTCTEMCMDRKCDSKTGQCLGGCTNSVLTGHNCSDVCSRGCKDRECSQNGECLTKGCNLGYWGTGCRTLCYTECAVPSDPTLSACDATTGVCLHGCSSTSHWGSHCKDTCGMNCDLPSYHSQRVRVCDINTGHCLHGCMLHVSWGPTCTYPCLYRCKLADYGQNTCNEDRGECLHGCKDDRHWGPSCDRLCSETCADKVCLSGTGACLRGCIDGYEGEHCEMKDFCFLAEIPTIAIIILLGVSVIFNLVLVLRVCCCRRYK